MRLHDKLRQMRKTQRLNQDDMAKKLSISRRSYGLYELGKTLPDAGRLAEIATIFGVSTDWLLSDSDALSSAPAASPQELPLIGLASCSVAGWYQPQPLNGMNVPLPTTELQDGFVVTATGPSLIPEGIKPGYMCYCAPNIRAKMGDIIYIQEVSGRASLKVFREETPDWLVIDGYFPPNDAGTQARYTEKRQRTEIDSIAPVMFVRRK